MDAELVIAFQLVDFVIHEGVHVFVEVVGQAHVNVVNQIFAPHPFDILPFRQHIAEGRTQTEVELILGHRFQVLRFVGKAAADRGHLAGFRVHGRQVDIVGVIFQAGRPGFRFRTLAAGQQVLIVGTVGAGVGCADGEVAAAEIIA
ncbi:hypothetical protein BGU35_18970 [Clostridioides difficile]|nr:hypothetical protein BGU35_18970 [Clostridioides difficile]